MINRIQKMRKDLISKKKTPKEILQETLNIKTQTKKERSNLISIRYIAEAFLERELYLNKKNKNEMFLNEVVK